MPKAMGKDLHFASPESVIKTPESEERTNMANPLKTLDGIRIFLAEDEFINQRIISAYLEEQGCSVTVCANGQELLDAMEKIR